MQKQFSSGAIIFYEGRNGREYLLLKDPYGRWTFPRGIVKEEENSVDAVKRDVTEEIGLKQVEFISGFKETQQSMFTFEAELILKKVTWYLAKSAERKVKRSNGHQDYKWCKLNAANRLIDIRTNQNLLKKVDEFLEIPRLI